MYQIMETKPAMRWLILLLFLIICNCEDLNVANRVKVLKLSITEAESGEQDIQKKEKIYSSQELIEVLKQTPHSLLSMASIYLSISMPIGPETAIKQISEFLNTIRNQEIYFPLKPTFPHGQSLLKNLDGMSRQKTFHQLADKKQKGTINQNERKYTSVSESSSSSSAHLALALIAPTTNSITSFSSASPNIQSQIGNFEFTGIKLHHETPLIFVSGEVYKFHGTVTDKSLVSFSTNSPPHYNFINVIFSKVHSPEEIRCAQQLDSSLKFEVSCKIGQAGIYYLSVFAGRYGQSSSRIRQVVKTPFKFITDSPPPQPTNLRLEIINNFLYVKWDSKAAITNLTIQQNNRIQSYILSNFHSSFKIPNSDFVDFSEMLTNMTISHALSQNGGLNSISSEFSKNVGLQFQAVEHKFSDIMESEINVGPQIPWKVQLGERLEIRAKFQIDIFNQIYFVSPSKQISTIKFNPISPLLKVIKSGTLVSANFSFNESGTHLIQINADSGQAVLNRPIYVGEVYPLLPDFQDLKLKSPTNSNSSKIQALQNYFIKSTSSQKVSLPEINSSIETQRNYLLFLANSLRLKYSVQQVYLDSMLNQIAQMHADDMRKNDYFSHKNQQNQGPKERAQEKGFTSSIGQNIVMASSLTEAHLSLERSAAHLQNTVNSDWTRVGIGISTGKDNQYIVVFEFSGRDMIKQPFTPNQAESSRESLIDFALQSNPSFKTENKTLSSSIKSWMESNRSTQLFEYLSGKGFRSSMSSTFLKLSYQPNWIEKVKSQSTYFQTNSKYNQIGLNLAVDSKSAEIEIIFVFIQQ